MWMFFTTVNYLLTTLSNIWNKCIAFTFLSIVIYMVNKAMTNLYTLITNALFIVFYYQLQFYCHLNGYSSVFTLTVPLINKLSYIFLSLKFYRASTSLTKFCRPTNIRQFLRFKAILQFRAQSCSWSQYLF